VTFHSTDFHTVLPHDDRRDGERMATTYRAARLTTIWGQQQLGIVRNVSSGGLMIETHAEIAVGDRLWIEPRACRSMWGRVRWSEGPRHGMAFDAPIPLESLLTLAQAEPQDQVARAPRITLDLKAQLRIASAWHVVRLCDLSQSGAKFASALRLTQGEPVTLNIDGLRSVDGYVRWQRDDRIGLLFAEPISIRSLSLWIAATKPPAGPHELSRDITASLWEGTDRPC